MKAALLAAVIAASTPHATTYEIGCWITPWVKVDPVTYAVVAEGSYKDRCKWRTHAKRRGLYPHRGGS